MSRPRPWGSEDLYQLSREELAERGIRMLPLNLGEAIELFEGSELMREVLGDHIHRFLVDAKRAEWSEYLGTVSAWETERYLHVL